MTIDSSNMNPNWTPPPAKPGMSGGMKVLIGAAIGCSVIVVLCCAGLAVLAVYIGSWAQKGMSTDAAAVREMSAGMAKIDVPAGLEPAVAVHFKDLPWGQGAGQVMPKFVVYRDLATNSQLILASAPGGGSVRDRRQIRAQADAMLGQGKPGGDEDLKVEKTYSKEVKIGDEDVTFTITVGKSPSTGKKRINAVGEFEGNEEPVTLLLSADADKYSEETVIKMLESIEVDSEETDSSAPSAEAQPPAAPQRPKAASDPKS